MPDDGLTPSSSRAVGGRHWCRGGLGEWREEGRRVRDAGKWEGIEGKVMDGDKVGGKKRGTRRILREEGGG